MTSPTTKAQAHFEYLKQQDEELFYNYPSQAADFQFWAKADGWTADEAVALTFGRSPSAVNWGTAHSSGRF